MNSRAEIGHRRQRCSLDSKLSRMRQRKWQSYWPCLQSQDRQRALIAFLQDRDKNLYEWQEAWFSGHWPFVSPSSQLPQLLSNQVEDV